MRIVCLSDTHTMHGRIDVPDGDVLVHTGDFCGHGRLTEAEDFFRWLSLLPHRHKLVVAGNHDWCFQLKPSESRALVPPEVHYLQDRGVTIDGVNFYGMPWQPTFFDWAFNLPRNGWEMQAKCRAIPDDTHVLLTHGPPHGRHDQCPTRQGCEVLAERVAALPDLKLHVFGHIHEGAGCSEDERGTTYVNASVCTRGYEPTNPVHVVELNRKRFT